jgi:cold shock CspA family protein
MTVMRGRLRGRVVHFDPDKGFGRLRGADGTSWFLHVREIKDRQIPAVGEYAWYDEGQYHGRPCAINVHLTQGEDADDKPAKVPSMGDVFADR